MLFVAAGVVVACMTVFALIAEDLVDGGGLISRDETVLQWFVDHRTDRMVSVARLVSTVGGFVSLCCLSFVLAGWLWRRGWKLAVAPLTSLLLAGLAATVAKAIFGRARPPIALHGVRATSPAFPSGHAADAAGFFLAAAFVLALTVAHSRRTQLALIVVAIVSAALVGISRLVLAVHWLSDVVAGWALGTAIATTVVAVFWYLSIHRNPNQRSQDLPPTQ
jgi:undecaprenyl-diphosphatase